MGVGGDSVAAPPGEHLSPECLSLLLAPSCVILTWDGALTHGGAAH